MVVKSYIDSQYQYVRMSILVLTTILSEMGIWLSRQEVEKLYFELLTYFGLVGARDKCQALESAWKDPYNRRLIEEFIKAWLSRKRKRDVLAEYVEGYR